MFCPQCGARTYVTETRGPFRDRRCTNAACRLGFTTCENAVTQREHRRLCARTRATQAEAPPRAPAVGSELGPTCHPNLGVAEDSGEGPRAVQGEQKCAQAGVAG